jgi:hypothetical protein
MHWLVSQAVEQPAVQRGSYALAAAPDVECDTDLDGLPKAFMIPVGLACGIAQDLIPAPRYQKPVRTGRGETLKPFASLGDAGGLGGEGGVRVCDRVIEDVHDRRQISLRARPDRDGFRASG